MDQETEQRIRRRAYDLWLADGKPEGCHLRFWKESEAQILAEDAASGSTADPVPQGPNG